MVLDCLEYKGLRCVCIREVQKTLAQSAKLLIEDKIRTLGVAHLFDVQREQIITPGKGLILFNGMADHTAESIKSLEGFRRAWIEEAQTLSARSLELLRPTIRDDADEDGPDSEIWASWNPRRKGDAIDKFLRVSPPEGAMVIKANWRDNPWFPKVLEAERLHDLEHYPDRYQHIWEGDYVTIFEGAYFAQQLKAARAEDRITRLAADPVLRKRAFCDIGGAGAHADAMAIWIVQFAGREIHALDYIEGVGQVLGYYADILRKSGHEDALIVLPHDGVNANNITGKRYADHWEDAGFETQIIENQGRGAAMMRIEAARRLFPRIWFNEKQTEAGRDALGAYHERKDEERGVGLGPEHDWCLAQGTQVLCPEGWRDVDGLAVHDQVLTPCGTRRILRSGIVRMTDQWVTLRGIRCTPEHRFFTSRGLVEAGGVSSQDRLWTRGDLGLSILGSLCAISRSGLRAAITSLTLADTAVASRDGRSSYIGWCMRLLTGQLRRAMKSITSTMIRSTIIPTTLKASLAFNTGANTSRSLGTSAHAAYVAATSAATSGSGRDAVLYVAEPTMRDSHANTAPAFNITVERDECYYVRGNDGRAYLVSNSSHGADAFGLMCVAYEEPRKKEQNLEIPKFGTV